jgi:hypothetical protein
MATAEWCDVVVQCVHTMVDQVVGSTGRSGLVPSTTLRVQPSRTAHRRSRRIAGSRASADRKRESGLAVSSSWTTRSPIAHRP